MIAVQILPQNETRIEFETMQILAAAEAERCPECKQVHRLHNGALPLRCNTCDRSHDDRWYIRLRARARALVLFGNIAADTGEKATALS